MVEEKCPGCGQDLSFKWSWGKFWKGKASNKFIAWVMSTILVFRVLSSESMRDNISHRIIIIVWGAATVIFMLAGAIDTAVSNAKITAELKAGINKEVTSD